MPPCHWWQALPDSMDSRLSEEIKQRKKGVEPGLLHSPLLLACLHDLNGRTLYTCGASGMCASEFSQTQKWTCS